MKRTIVAIALGTLFSFSCGGGGSSPTTPTPATAPQTAAAVTRIIGVTGNLVFGEILTGATATSTITITNTGNVALTISGMSAPSAASGIYRTSWANGTITPGGSQVVTITFAPAAAITYNGTLIVNGDQTSGSNTLPITGAGSPASKVSLIGVIASSTGQRITGATLRILDGPNAGRSTTSTNGDYRFDNLSVGNANLSARGSGLVELILGLFINGANSLNFTLSIAPTPTPTPTPSPSPSPSGGYRVGARCKDGSRSDATGSGACSYHGGVQCWIYNDGSCRSKLAIAQ
jgi:hypothetical protein